MLNSSWSLIIATRERYHAKIDTYVNKCHYFVKIHHIQIIVIVIDGCHEPS